MYVSPMDMHTYTHACTPPEPEVKPGRWENLPYDLVAIKTLQDGIFSARRRISESQAPVFLWVKCGNTHIR